MWSAARTGNASGECCYSRPFMLKIYNCITTAHDLRLVVLAAIACALSSFATFRLLHHARTVHGQMRHIWLAVSAVSIGFGIWSTHFIAMLAFSPGIPSGYNISLTALSLMAAILLTGAGLAVAMMPNWRAGPVFGGAIGFPRTGNKDAAVSGTG